MSRSVARDLRYNPAPSSGESVSRGISPSHVEKPGFSRRCAHLNQPPDDRGRPARLHPVVVTVCDASEVPMSLPIPTPPPEAKLFHQPRSPLRIAERGDRMFSRQVPASTIFSDAQSMAGGWMRSEHLTAPPAFKTNHVVPVNGSPD